MHATDLLFAGRLSLYATAYGITGLTNGGCIDVQNLLNVAKTTLGQVGSGGPGSDPNAPYAATLAQVFQAATANTNFVSQEMWWVLVGL